MRIIGGFFGKHAGIAKGAIHLIGRHVVKTMFVIRTNPLSTGGIQQVHGAYYVGEHELIRAADGPIYMRFGRQVDDRIGLFGCKQAVNRSEEHTSELQSLMRLSYAGLCLKKKT